MDILKILIATLAATTAMTAFSYLLSEAFQKLFKEPVLLNYVLELSGIKLGDRSLGAAGWLLHYIIGLIFVITYYLIWTYTNIRLSWVSGVVFGCISGIIGILGWVVLFKLPSKEPRVAFTAYYIQLFYAHIVFALIATAVFKAF